MGLWNRIVQKLSRQSFKMVQERGNGFYAWNGSLYHSDVVRACIRPKTKAIGKAVAKHMLDIWGTLLGFLITAVSLFLTIGDGKYMNTLKSSGHFATVLYSYIICCIHLFVAVVFALIIVFLKVWNMTVFILLCATVIDTLIIVAICLFFLFFIVINTNK